ncbi:MAG TPA: hypothetical protein PK280_07925 [Planctomycetota bacterium]|nr:hypothetical protein [Planctomycetota bacterium]
MNAVKPGVEAPVAAAVNEMRAVFGLPGKVPVISLWALVRGEARAMCARAEPAPGEERRFEAFLEAVRRTWRRPEPPPTHGEVAFLAALCGRSGLSGDAEDHRPEQVGRFLYALLRFVSFSGSFPRITVADLDQLSFSVHLDMLPAAR